MNQVWKQYRVLHLSELLDNRPQELAAIYCSEKTAPQFHRAVEEHGFNSEQTTKERIVQSLVEPGAVPVFTCDQEFPGLPESCVIGTDAEGEIVGIWQVTAGLDAILTEAKEA
jgi:hypothetical protein